MILITGGAGFIGSHLVDRLVGNGKVRVVDNLSSSTTKFIEPHIKRGEVEFFKTDVDKTGKDVFEGVDRVYHLMACPIVKISHDKPQYVFESNVVSTFKLLEKCRLNDVKKFIFMSSSTVYGNANILPTPETCILEPVSNYGATKMASEAVVSSYAHSYGIKATVLRLANIFGPRSTHGIMHDFFMKLKDDRKQITILGDGQQNKSYLYVDDCIDAVLCAEKSPEKFGVFNVGSDSQIKAEQIARLMAKLLGLGNIKLNFTGGNVGWSGDVPNMLLDCKKMKSAGWLPKVKTDDGIKMYVEWMKKEYGF